MKKWDYIQPEAFSSAKLYIHDSINGKELT